MLESQLISHLLLTAIQLLTGLFVNAIIVVVHGTGLLKHRKMIPLEALVSCLAMSRICLELAIFYLNLAVFNLIDIRQFVGKFVILSFVNELGLWFATWLSVFYCIKIARIAHPLFLWLKLKISKLVPWLILGSLLHASSTCVFHSKQPWIFSEDLLGFSSQNATAESEDIATLRFTLLFAELSLPSLIFLVSALLLLFSLGRHTWQMRNTATGPCPRARVRSLLSIFAFLVLYLCHYLMVLLLFSQVFKLTSLRFLFCISLVGSCHSGHSIILILGNPKLKQNAEKFLLHRKCRQ
ncbi:taste receptor type 2 member 1 [Camelus dromedarius]|uniref:taste receptor type 2 member 1 n=1 Tax=Camelus dromedarius TaxID=9838 RepID=UPI00057BB796|nr:taste receptor type 2 member 1 [Camelus dromedarius]